MMRSLFPSFVKGVQNENLRQQVNKEKEKFGSALLIFTLTNEFDEWCIEEYIRDLSKIQATDLVILVEDTNDCTKPTFHTINELEGALEYFANFIGVQNVVFNVNVDGSNMCHAIPCKVYRFENRMNIYFEEG